MIRRLLIPILCALALASCTTVLPLTEEEGLTTQVHWDFAWQDGTPTQQPDFFLVALLRTFSTEHLVFAVNPVNAQPVKLSIGDYLAVGAGCVPMDAYSLVYIPEGGTAQPIEETVTPTDPEQGGSEEQSGDNDENNEDEGTKADGEGDEPSANSWDPASYYAQIHDLTVDQINEKYGTHGWLDPSFPVLEDAQPLYISKAHQELLGGDAPEVLKLETHSAVQEITVRCTLQTEGDVVIDEVVASMCGTARRVQVVSGAVSFDNGQLGQNIFFLQNVGGNTWEGSFRCLGLFPAEQSDFSFGPGMLQLHIHATTGPITRYLEARINLKNLIEQAKILENPAGSTYYTITSRAATLTIEKPLEITEESVHADGEIFIDWDEDNDVYNDANGDPLEF